MTELDIDEGDLGATPITRVLEDLERRRITAIARFDTEAGLAEVELSNGAIVDARMEELSGRGALFRLFGITGGRFELSFEPIVDRPPLTPSVAQALDELARWHELSERAPALSSVANLSREGREALSVGALEPQDRALLGLADGRRALAEIIDESGLDAVEGLARLVSAVDSGLLVLVGTDPSLYPLRPVAVRGAERVPPERVPSASSGSDAIVSLPSEHLISDRSSSGRAPSQRVPSEQSPSGHASPERGPSEGGASAREPSQRIRSERAPSERASKPSLSERATSERVASKPSLSERAASERAPSDDSASKKRVESERALSEPAEGGEPQGPDPATIAAIFRTEGIEPESVQSASSPDDDLHRTLIGGSAPIPEGGRAPLVHRIISIDSPRPGPSPIVSVRGADGRAPDSGRGGPPSGRPRAAADPGTAKASGSPHQAPLVPTVPNAPAPHGAPGLLNTAGPPADEAGGPFESGPRKSTLFPPVSVGVPEPAPEPPPPDGLAGARFIGRYQVLCRIGRGGMGSVYLCRLMSEGGFRRLFALKLLRKHLLADSVAAQRFLEEARLAGHIHHPNVVGVVDAGLHGSQPYLVMDYVEGGSLRDLLAAHPVSRPPELVLPIILDALAGLHCAHTLVGDDGVPLEIVHCDVSPENLLVGIDGVCRLTDFGVARQGIRAREQSRFTHGKPGYVAPEQITQGRIDARADVFALGVVLYNALTGTKLFDGQSVDEVLQQVCSRRIEPPSTVGLRPPPSLDFVCMRALERDPERRFVSAEEMMMELRRVALRENLLAPTSEIAAWVRESVGHDLARRRLVVLEASRQNRPQANPAAPLAISNGGGPPMAPHAKGPDGDEGPPSSHGLDQEPDHLSRTIALEPQAPKPVRWAIVVASVLAAVAVLVTVLFPSLVSRMFRTSNAVAPTHGELLPTPSFKPASSPPPPEEAAAP